MRNGKLDHLAASVKSRFPVMGGPEFETPGVLNQKEWKITATSVLCS